MTVEELSELYYINKEITIIQKEIAKLKEMNFYKKPIISDMPKGSNRGTDILTEYVDDMRTLETMLLYNLRKLQEKRKTAEAFLESVKDAELRLIMRLRVVNNMSWYDIGDEVGKDRRTVSKKFYDFFKNCAEYDIDL